MSWSHYRIHKRKKALIEALEATTICIVNAFAEKKRKVQTPTTEDLECEVIESTLLTPKN